MNWIEQLKESIPVQQLQSIGKIASVIGAINKIAF
jgi:rRNA processing protein Gar1